MGMKRTLAIVLTTIILSMSVLPAATVHAVSSWTGSLSYNAGYAFNGGTGIDGDPYIITSETSLAQMAVNVNGGLTYSGVYFRLDSDLDLGGLLWVPIGSYSSY